MLNSYDRKTNHPNQQIPQPDFAPRTRTRRPQTRRSRLGPRQRLLAAVNQHGTTLTRERLNHIVATSDKKRFAFSNDGQRIRASQGHSVEIDLQYSPQQPPEILYHGTATRFLHAIRQNGLQKMSRHDVHLSAETKMTLQVGGRHGKPVLLKIRAGEMHRAGFVFRCSANNVWLVDHVPPQFIEFPGIS